MYVGGLKDKIEVGRGIQWLFAHDNGDLVTEFLKDRIEKERVPHADDREIVLTDGVELIDVVENPWKEFVISKLEELAALPTDKGLTYTARDFVKKFHKDAARLQTQLNETAGLPLLTRKPLCKVEDLPPTTLTPAETVLVETHEKPSVLVGGIEPNEKPPVLVAEAIEPRGETAAYEPEHTGWIPPGSREHSELLDKDLARTTPPEDVDLAVENARETEGIGDAKNEEF